VLANDPIKVNKLMRHLKTKHGSLAGRDAEFLRERLELQRKIYLIVMNLDSKKKMLLKMKLYTQMHKELQRIKIS
jgi:hypothetical protein